MNASWRPLVRAAIRVDRNRIDLGGALRCTIGVVVPLVVGLASGAVADGVAAAVGALCAGFTSFQGAYRSRAVLTLVVAAGMAVSTVVGALATHNAVAAVLVTTGFGLVAGMAAALGQAAIVTTLQWVVAELIVGVIPMTAAQAVVRACAVLAGGVLQTLLVVVLWPFANSVVERRALQAVYADLAASAERAASDEATGVAIFGSAATTMADARAALADPQPLGHAARLLALQALVDEAERIRAELVVLERHRGRLSEPSRRRLGALLSTVAVALRCVARALARDEEPTVTAEWAAELAGRVTMSEELLAAGESAWVVGEVATAAEALRGQIRSALRLAAVSAGRSDPMLADRRLPARRHVMFRDSLRTLRANVSWHSTTFRHALRLGTTLAVAEVIYRDAGLPHGYWVPLTVLVVLRPDYSSTTVRGLSRMVGTVVGAGIATLIAALVRPDDIGLAVLFGTASFGAFLLVRANYALFTITVTSYVVFLLAFVKLPELTAVGDRLLDTVIGGALAIGAYLLWPTWESRLIGSQLAALLGAQGDYMGAVLAVWIEPSSARGQLADLRARARLARSNTGAALDRLVAEPRRSVRPGLLDAERHAASPPLPAASRLPSCRCTPSCRRRRRTPARKEPSWHRPSSSEPDCSGACSDPSDRRTPVSLPHPPPRTEVT